MMKLDDLAHRAATDLRRSGEAARFAASSPARTSPITRIRTAVLVLAAAALAIGLPLSILISRDGDSRPDPASLSGPTESIMIAGIEYPVGELVDSFSTQQMYLPHLQPDPSFDTANLGDRMVLPLMDPTVSDDRILNGPSIYLGEVGADSAFLTDNAEFGGEEHERPASACVWIGDERICSVPGAGPWTFRSGSGTFAMWVGVPDGTAAVVVSDDSGPLGWQVPRSQSVVLSVPSLAVVATALDHDGQGLVSFDLSDPNVPVTVPALLGATVPPQSEPVIETTPGQWVRTNPDLGGLLVQSRDLIWSGEAFYVLTRVGFGDVQIWRSEDGMTWAEYPTFGPVGTLDGPWALTTSGEALIAGGNREGEATIWVYGPDSGWVETTLGHGMVRFLATTGDTIVAFGDDRAIDPNGTATPRRAVMWTSGDQGATWQQVALPAFVSEEGLRDGSSTSLGLADGPGGLIAISAAGELRVHRSIDGYTWDLAETDLSGFVVSLTSDESGYLVQHDDGRIRRSFGGIHWVDVPQPAFTEGTPMMDGVGLYAGVVHLFGGVNFVPPGSEYNATFPRLWFTIEDGLWSHLGPTDGLFAEGGVIYGIAANNTTVVAVGESGLPDQWAIFTFTPEL